MVWPLQCPVQGQELDSMVLMDPFQLSLFCGFRILKCAFSRSPKLSVACVKGGGPASHWHPHCLRDIQALVWHLPSMPLGLVVVAATSFLLFAPCPPDALGGELRWDPTHLAVKTAFCWGAVPGAGWGGRSKWWHLCCGNQQLLSSSLLHCFRALGSRARLKRIPLQMSGGIKA